MPNVKKAFPCADSEKVNNEKPAASNRIIFFENFSRRQFLTGLGLTLGFIPLYRIFGEESSPSPSTTNPVISHILYGEEDELGWDLAEIVRSVDPLSSPLKARLLRTEDLLLLELEFINLELVPEKRNRNIFDVIFGLKRSRKFSIKKRNSEPAFVIAHFPPQHITEEAFFEAVTNGDPVPPPPVRSIMAGPTRIAFKFPDEVTTLPYNLTSLLDWAKYHMQISPVALPRDEATTDAISEPKPTDTSIELPYRLILSPNHYGAWLHSNSPVSRSQTIQSPGNQPEDKNQIQWTELWHTRLGVRIGDSDPDESNSLYKTARAIWSRDTRPPSPAPDLCLPVRKPSEFGNGAKDGDNFLRSMTAQDRNEIVQLTSNFNDLLSTPDNDPKVKPQKYDPVPIEVEKLFLTSLGGSLTSQASWPIVTGTNGAEFGISDWREEVSIGRDQYVRIVYRGFLYPFGHPCTLVQVTYRKFQPADTGDKNNIGAYLRQKITIAIRNPRLELGNTGIGDNGSADRRIPFRSMDVLTLETPPLEPPECSRIYPLPTPFDCKSLLPDDKTPDVKVCAFWPMLGDAKFLFHFGNDDHAGSRSECFSPAIFIVHSMAKDDKVMQEVEKAWEKSNEGKRDMKGQEIAFAPSKESKDTTFETLSITFSAEREKTEKPVKPSNLIASLNLIPDMLEPQDACQLPPKEKPAPWTPTADEAEVKVPAVQHLTGSDKPTVIEYFPDYAKKGFEGNPGEIFAKIKGPEFKHELPDSRSLGLALPPLDIRGFSRRFGAVSSRPRLTGDNSDPLEGFNLGDFNPQTMLKGLKAKILGFLELENVLDNLASFDKSGSDRVPAITTRILYDQRGLPEVVEASHKWVPKLSEKPSYADEDKDSKIVTFKWLDKHNMVMTIITETRLRESGKSSVRLNVVLENFSVTIVGSIRVMFSKLELNVKPGQKPDIKVNIDNVVFMGALAWVNELQKYLSQQAFGKNGPTILITPFSATASMGFKLPTIAIGVFSLQDVRLGVRLVIPFKGDKPMTLRFAFGERHDTFLVAGTIFGGGGFLALTFSVKGIVEVELAIEFGCVGAIGVGIAEGEAHILGGIFINYRREAGTTITGYLRAGGSLTMYGMVTVAVELYHGLAYDPATGRVWGEAELTVTISIGFFSKDVSFTVRHEFIGGKDDSGNAALLQDVPRAIAAGGNTEQSAGCNSNREHTPFYKLVAPEQWEEYWKAFTI